MILEQRWDGGMGGFGRRGLKLVNEFSDCTCRYRDTPMINFLRTSLVYGIGHGMNK